MKSVRTVAAVIVVAMLALPTSALALVTVKVTPRNPSVDSSITASWKVNKPLKKGSHYEAAVIGASGADCASIVVKSSKTNPKKGKTASIRISSFDDSDESLRWCKGTAQVMISTVKNGDETGDTGKMIGIGEVRFR